MYSNFFPVSISLFSSEIMGGSNILYNKTKNIGQASLASHLNTQQLHKRSCNISEKTIGLSNWYKQNFLSNRQGSRPPPKK